MSLGVSLAAASVTRRWATMPSGSALGLPGATSGHQVTTGTSGASSGATTESACWPSGPYMRSRMVSPGPVSPTRISASRRDSPLGLRVMTARIRLGCSRPAWLAARTASYCSDSSVTMISVSTVPEAGPPIRRRAWVSASWIAPVLVSVRSMVNGASLEPAPYAAVPSHHRVGRRGPGRAGRILVWLGVGGPEVLDRIEDPPAELDLGLPGEERGVADEDVEQQPLVGLRAGLGERLAVGEVHVHVADLHGRTRHLRAEPDRDALVRLDPDHQRVLAEFLGVGGGERQVRRALEDQRDLRHPPRQPLACPQVERHPGPAPGVDAEPQRRIGLGTGVRGNAVLLEETAHLAAALPAGRVLPARGALGDVGGQPDRG